MTVNESRIKKIRRLLGCRTDVELADYLGTNQPQISRWRNAGFHGSAYAVMIDALLVVIADFKKEIKGLKKELSLLKKE